jgi:hypothetical protein
MTAKFARRSAALGVLSLFATDGETWFVQATVTLVFAP